MEKPTHFEDFAVGTQFALGPYTISKEEIIRFASKFDPQPMHLDEEAARESLLGNLSASGWHTTSLLMKLINEGVLKDTTSQGAPGVKDVNWPAPVYPGDTLTGLSEVTDTRRSRSNPQIGLVSFHHKLKKQDGTLVCEWKNPVFFKCRKEGVEE